ncbi:unnamed protein product [Alopecurus aequalis]
MVDACPVVLASRHPAEVELISKYLRPRTTSGKSCKSWGFIHHADVYTVDPMKLTETFLPARTVDGEEVWYFFSLVKTKSLHGQRKARTVESGAGCWHSEAGCKSVLDAHGRRVGRRQFFSFVIKKNRKRIRTGWLMVELGLDRQQDENMPSEELVLCKIYFTPRSLSSPDVTRPAQVADKGKRKTIDGSPDEAPPVRQCCHGLPEATAWNNVETDVAEVVADVVEEHGNSRPPDSPSTPTRSASPPSSPSSLSPPSPTSSISPTTPPPLSMPQPTPTSSMPQAPPEKPHHRCRNIIDAATNSNIIDIGTNSNIIDAGTVRGSSSSIPDEDETLTLLPDSSSSSTHTAETPYFVLPSLDYSTQEVYVICRGDCSVTHKVTRGDCRVSFAICKGDCHN